MANRSIFVLLSRSRQNIGPAPKKQALVGAIQIIANPRGFSSSNRAPMAPGREASSHHRWLTRDTRIQRFMGLWLMPKSQRKSFATRRTEHLSSSLPLAGLISFTIFISHYHRKSAPQMSHSLLKRLAFSVIFV